MAIASRIRSGADVYDLPALTLSDIAAGFVFLPVTPSYPQKVIIEIGGGVPQVYNVDYIITGNRIIWNALGMQTVLSEGDRMRIIILN